MQPDLLRSLDHPPRHLRTPPTLLTLTPILRPFRQRRQPLPRCGRVGSPPLHRRTRTSTCRNTILRRRRRPDKILNIQITLAQPLPSEHGPDGSDAATPITRQTATLPSGAVDVSPESGITPAAGVNEAVPRRAAVGPAAGLVVGVGAGIGPRWADRGGGAVLVLVAGVEGDGAGGGGGEGRRGDGRVEDGGLGRVDVHHVDVGGGRGGRGGGGIGFRPVVDVKAE